MRVLLIAGDFPPDPVMGSARAGALAEHLVRSGHSVKVITRAGPWGGPDGAYGQVEQTKWVRLPVFEMVRPGPFVIKPDSDRFPTPGQRGKLRGQVARIAHGALSFPDPQGGWLPFAYAAGLRAVAARDPEIVFSSGPSFASHIAASLVARRAGIPWAADYRDLWSNSPYYPYGKLRKRLDSIVERKVIDTASLVTAVSHTLATDLARDFGVPARVIRNGYDPVELAPVADRAPLSPARLNMLYVGNNLYGGRRTPQLLFRAAREARVEVNDVRFHFLGTDPNDVNPIARAESVEDLVEFHAPVSRAQSIAMQARSDALMLLMWDDPREGGTLPGKLFEYAGVRRPVILIGYAHGEAAEIVRNHSLGWVAHDLHGARAALEMLLASKQQPVLLPDLPDDCRRGLAREQQFRVLEDMLAGVVRPPRKARHR